VALTASQLAARREIEGLLAGLELPRRAPGMEHLQSRRSWHDRVVDYYHRLAPSDSVAS